LEGVERDCGKKKINIAKTHVTARMCRTRRGKKKKNKVKGINLPGLESLLNDGIWGSYEERGKKKDEENISGGSKSTV